MGWLKNCTNSEIDWIYNHFVVDGRIQQPVGVAHQKARRNIVEDYITWSKEKSVGSFAIFEQSLRARLATESLQEEDLNWLDAKDRLQCLLVWGLVTNLFFYDKNDAEVNSVGNLGHTPKFGYEISSFKKSAFTQIMTVSHEEKSSLIVVHVKDFFQRLHGARNNKATVLRALRDHYLRLLQSGSPLYFIANTDAETRSWAWAYLGGKGVPTRYLKANEYDVEPEHLIVAFELWQASPAEKELLLHRLKAAYSQRKTRMKRNHRKAYQIYLTAERKEMLNELSWHYDKKIYEVVEHLISQAYTHIKK